jgi:hypothetical protein
VGLGGGGVGKVGLCEAQPPGGLKASPGLYGDCFTLASYKYVIIDVSCFTLVPKGCSTVFH